MALKRISLPRPTGASASFASAALDMRSKNDSAYLDEVLSSARVLGSNPWKWFQRIGEIHFAVNRAAKIAGYATLKAVELDDDGKVVGDLDDADARSVVANIYSPFGGVRGLIERYYTLMKIPADSHLIRVVDKNGFDGYHFMSPQELGTPNSPLVNGQVSRGLTWTTLPRISNWEGGEKSRTVRKVAGKDYLGRVWTPSPMYVDLPESPLEPLDGVCDILDAMTKSQRATMRSRFALAGLLYFPDTINALVAGDIKAASGDEILEKLKVIFGTNVMNTEDAIAVTPILMRGPEDAGEKIKHILLDRKIFDEDLKLRGELIDRILFGLDIQVEATKGNEGTSHWGAWSNNADELRLAVMPDLDAMCWALTRLVFHGALRNLGWGDDKILHAAVGYDLSKASIKANKAEDVRQAEDRGAASPSVLRRESGLVEDDAPTNDEYTRWVGRLTKNPYLMEYGSPNFDKIDWDIVLKFAGKTGRKADGEGGDPESAPGQGDPGSPDDTEDDTPDSQKPI